MTILLTAEELIEINELYGGPGQGVRDLEGIRSVVDRPTAGFGAYEEYPTIWAKAAALLHGIASTQYFHNGNKRTAWIAANVFLGVNGYQLREPTLSINSFAFTLIASIGKDDFDISHISEWLEENRLRASDRIRHAILGMAEPLNRPTPQLTPFRLPIQAMTVPKFPSKPFVTAIVGVNWFPIDAGREKTVHAEFRDDANGSLLIDNRTEMRSVTGLVVRGTETPWYPNGLYNWSEYLTLPLLAKAPGSTFVDVYIDGELAWSENLTWQPRTEIPDGISAEFMV